MHKFFRRQTIGLFLLFICPFISTSLLADDNHPQVLPPYSLEECYQLTLQNSETLKIGDEQLKISEAQYKEALALIYPQFSYQINHTIRDNANFGRVNKGRVSIDDPSTPVGGSGGILGRTQTAGVVALTQPLFNGFRDFILSEAAEKQTDIVKLQNVRARELLYQDVASLFNQIIFSESELKVIGQAKKTLESRVGELQEFIKLGKSRESEVLAARSDLADLETTVVQSRGLLIASKELLAFLTGVSADSLVLDNKKEIRILEKVEHYLELSKERSDIKASQLTIDSEQLKLKAAHRERWPQFDLSANAYTIDDPDRNRDWEMFIQMSVPIFDGGQITARTEAGEARVRTANLQVAQKIRMTERDIRVAYANTSAAREQIESLKKLKAAARKNFDLQNVDYSNGVVTNLEVLQAIRQLQETERRLLKAEEQFQSNLVTLRVSAGGAIQ